MDVIFSSLRFFVSGTPRGALIEIQRAQGKLCPQLEKLVCPSAFLTSKSLQFMSCMMSAVREQGTVPVTARLPHGTRANLRDLLNQERMRRAALAANPRWNTQRLSRRRMSEVRAAWRLRLAVMRHDGELLDTLDALVAFGVRRELEERGWDRLWPACPPMARSAGRWPGSREGGFPEQLSFRLPASLESQVRAACWYTSARAIADLQDWQDHYRAVLAKRRRPPSGMDDVFVIYDRLAARITTTGSVWRAGVCKGIETASRLNGPYRR
ncbi:hypothetical protein ACF1AB_39970 [Streptomyces sp. NPDC014846]|uniref:hypothetical protein n=1 Tax=Streptomyces sp. NPDC014846 TaxID=3364922 RepID=UPI0036F54D41